MPNSLESGRSTELYSTKTRLSLDATDSGATLGTQPPARSMGRPTGLDHRLRSIVTALKELEMNKSGDAHRQVTKKRRHVVDG